MHKFIPFIVLAGLFAWLGAAPDAFAGSNALIDTLEKKGLLTSREASELKEETYRETRETFPACKIVLGNWLDQLRISGDARVRYEEFFHQKMVRLDEWNAGNPVYGPVEQRTRFRYRLRLAIDAEAGDFFAGVRLASGENQAGAAGNGDPVSTNTTIDNTASHKPVYIDRAYVTWNPGEFEQMTLTAGKFANPFFTTQMLFCSDLSPEGAAELFLFDVTEELKLFFNAGQLVVEESVRPIGEQGSGQGRDVYLFAEQFGADWAIDGRKLRWKTAVALYSFDGLNQSPITLPKCGNSMFNGGLRNSINSIDFNNELWIAWNENFPITLYGDYVNNLAGPGGFRSSIDQGWFTGLRIGQARRQGQWEVGYWYEELGANAFLDGFVDFNFGLGGTNNKGHILQARYAVTDYLTLAGTFYIANSVDDFVPGAVAVPGGAVVNGGDSRHAINHLFIDAEMRF